MQYRDGGYRCAFDPIKDQIIAMNAPADTVPFVARDEGEAVWTIDEIFTFAAQLSDE